VCVELRLVELDDGDVCVLEVSLASGSSLVCCAFGKDADVIIGSPSNGVCFAAPLLLLLPPLLSAPLLFGTFLVTAGWGRANAEGRTRERVIK
jgi:hypothetical protein